MASRVPIRRWIKWLPIILWAITLIGLPLTSFPLITNLTGATVAPFSAIPIALLGVIWFVPYVLRHGRLPKETVPFIVFTLFAVALAAYAFFEVDAYFRSISLFSQTIRTFAPLGLGLTFFLITSAWQIDSSGLRKSLQFIHFGGFLLLIWSLAQSVVVFFFNYNYPPLMEAIKNALVTQSFLTGAPRLAGLTWEPSWFAHQLNMLYLPLWLAATYQRTSVFRKIWKISFENIFLVLGMCVFFLSSPRIGAAACMLMLFFLFIKFNIAVYRWIIQRLERLWGLFRRFQPARVGVGVCLVILFIAVYFGFSAGLLKIVGARDWRVGLLLNSPLSPTELKEISAFDENALFLVGKRFIFLERTVYWIDGWHIFNDYPILGVGLGNTGYYYISHLPSIGYGSIEVRSILYQNDGLPNTKSMWYRLLAETGLIGFSLFITWLLVLWSSASKSLRSQDATIKTVALAGQLALVAYIFEGFSVDTFGLPYLFVMAGLVASAGAIYRRQAVSQKPG